MSPKSLLGFAELIAQFFGYHILDNIGYYWLNNAVTFPVFLGCFWDGKT